MTVRSPEYLTVFPLIQGTLKIAFGLKDSINPFDILTSEVKNGPAILGPILIPKEMKDITISGNKPGVQLSATVCWLTAFKHYILFNRC